MKLTLLDKKIEAKDTKTFIFSADEQINFEAGQYIYITLPKLNYTDQRGETRHFTISNSPTEGREIKITTRIRQESGYKRTLDELPLGSIVEGRGPQGTFIFSDIQKAKKINHVFIAGGIGITPFRSMIKYAIDTKINTPIYLIYSNSDSDFTFKNELDAWQKENDFLKIEYIDSSIDGRLEKVKLKNIFDSWNLNTGDFTSWVVGPNSFVNAIEEILEGLNVSEDNLITEKFTGY